MGQDVARMWEMAIQHALMPAVSTGVSHGSHRSGHSESLSQLTHKTLNFESLEVLILHMHRMLSF